MLWAWTEVTMLANNRNLSMTEFLGLVIAVSHQVQLKLCS